MAPSSRQSPRGKAKPGRNLITQRAGSAKWYLNFSIAGRRFRDSLGTEDEDLACELALKAFKEAEDEILRGVQPKVEEKHITLFDASVRWWDEVGAHTSYGRNQSYQIREMMRFFGGGTRLADINDDRVAQYVAHRMADKPSKRRKSGVMPGASPSTVNRDLSTLNVLMTRARDVWGCVIGAYDKGKHIMSEPEGAEVFLDYQDAERLLKAIVKHSVGPITFAMLTGLRTKNWLRVTWEEISLDMRRVVLVQKGGRRHVVDLIDEAVSLLEEIEPDPALRRGPVFYFGNANVNCPCSRCQDRRYQGQPMRDIKRSFDTARKAVGLPHLRKHDLRHSVASWLLASGYSLKVVQKVLGHSQITTTARYAHLEKGIEAKAMKQSLGRIGQTAVPGAKTA